MRFLGEEGLLLNVYDWGGLRAKPALDYMPLF